MKNWTPIVEHRLCFLSSSDESSWKKATDLLVEVASHGEDTGYEVPCLIVAAKDDLDSFPLAIQDSTRVIIFLYVPYIFNHSHRTLLMFW